MRLLLAAAFVTLNFITPMARASHPSVASRPKITGIAFMRVYTTDAAAAERFYGNTLGLAEKRYGSEQQFIVNRHQWVEVFSATPPSATKRMAAVAFFTDDVKGMAAYLQSQHVTSLDTKGAEELAVHDPEGNLVIFVQRGGATPQAVAASQTAPLPSATSHHIIHVGFIARDRAKEDAFWRGVLGFRPYWYGGMTPDKTEWVSMQVPDGTDWLEYMLGASAKPSLHETGVLDHFSLGTNSMNGVMAQLQKNGCEGKECTAVQMGKDGKIQLNMYDPDQTRVEFMEFTPAIKPCCSPFTGQQPKELEEDQR